MVAKVKAARMAKVRARQRAVTTTAPTTKPSWATRARASNWVFGLEVGAILATVVGLVVASWGLWEQVRNSRDDALARSDDALARNWTLVTTPASGNSGKVQALEYLASKGKALDGIDLSCKTMRGIDRNDKGQETCERPPYLIC